MSNANCLDRMQLILCVLAALSIVGLLAVDLYMGGGVIVRRTFSSRTYGG